MPSLRTIFVILILIALFMFFRPQIMRWVYTWKSEIAPVQKASDSSMKDFQNHDTYEREKKIEGVVDKLLK